MTPPLREKKNNALLWEGIERGEVDTIGTDHCAFNYMEQKQLGAGDYRKCPGGAPGVETRMPILFGKGVIGGRITPNRFAEITATTPAKLFGMYPQKGVIAVGSDADLVLMARRDITIVNGLLHENVDYTPYEGIRPMAWPTMTISRGEIIARADPESGLMSLTGGAGRGRFMKRGRFDEILSKA